MNKDLCGKVAIVTGAGRGIGRCIALTLARNGVRMSLAARTEAQLQAVQAEIEALGGEAASVPTDVSCETDVIALVRTTPDRYDRLDILINNAGIGIFKPFAETTAEEWDRAMAVNARGPFLLCREALPYLKQSDRATVINVMSVSSRKGFVTQGAYGASKHALMGMTKVLAKEVQEDGIRVHALCPGAVGTEMLAAARPDLSDPTVLIQPQEIADIVLFLVTHRGNAVVDQINIRRAVSTPWG